MKVVITLEDTPKGITVDGQVVLNGTTDHATDSLSSILMARLSVMLKVDRANGAINAEGNLML